MGPKHTIINKLFPGFFEMSWKVGQQCNGNHKGGVCLGVRFGNVLSNLLLCCRRSNNLGSCRLLYRHCLLLYGISGGHVSLGAQMRSVTRADMIRQFSASLTN